MPATSRAATTTATSSTPVDYKVSPFELESVLIEHPAVAAAAVVADRSTDPEGPQVFVRVCTYDASHVCAGAIRPR